MRNNTGVARGRPRHPRWRVELGVAATLGAATPEQAQERVELLAEAVWQRLSALERGRRLPGRPEILIVQELQLEGETKCNAS